MNDEPWAAQGWSSKRWAAEPRGLVSEVSAEDRPGVIAVWLEQTTPDGRLAHKVHEAEQWVAGMEARAGQGEHTEG